jgi:hypothetical protein
MTYYDISCFRHHDKQTSPSQVVYRLKYNGDDKNAPVNKSLEDTDLARKILLENKGNKNVDNALDGYFTRFEILKYESYS